MPPAKAGGNSNAPIILLAANKAFTLYSNPVIDYIQHQKDHQKKSFQEEYKSLLTLFQIDYKDEYLFEWMD